MRDESVKEKERKTKFDERHWSEKSLPQMAYRDWRIFREDYNIATKGGRIPYPLRSWAEAGISSDILEVIHSLHYKVDTSLVCTHATTNAQTYARTTHLLWYVFRAGANSYPEASYSYWFTEQGYHWNSRDWWVYTYQLP